jgi:hypothetical protein
MISSFAAIFIGASRIFAVALTLVIKDDCVDAYLFATKEKARDNFG